MKLIEAIEQLSTLDEDATLCARRPWTADSECTVIELDEGTIPKATEKAGFAYFLEVEVAREILGVFGKRKPTLDQKFRLIVFYAENDAFPDWVHE